MSDRDHDQIPAFLMAAPAAGYGSRFLARAGREYLIDPKDPTQDETMSPWYELSDHQDFMKFMAGNPEASGLLLAGRHGPDNHFYNTGTLFLYGPRYTDGGHALNALLQSGTHDLLASDPKVANAAAHNVILGAPEFDGATATAEPALVTILRDHMVDFDRAAVDGRTRARWRHRATSRSTTAGPRLPEDALRRRRHRPRHRPHRRPADRRRHAAGDPRPGPRPRGLRQPCRGPVESRCTRQAMLAGRR